MLSEFIERLSEVGILDWILEPFCGIECGSIQHRCAKGLCYEVQWKHIREEDTERSTFFAATLSNLRNERTFLSTTTLNKMDIIRSACQSGEFLAFVRSCGVINSTFEPYLECRVGSAVYDRFINNLSSAPDHAKLSVVFHGTRSKNIDLILRHGLDPAKRRQQTYGKGDYFAFDPAIASRYCRGGKEMIVFLIVEWDCQDSDRKPICPHEYALIDDARRQLPIGTLTFTSVTPSGSKRNREIRARMMERGYRAVAKAMEKRKPDPIGSNELVLAKRKPDPTGACYRSNELVSSSLILYPS